MPRKTPPQSPPRFDIEPHRLLEATEAIIDVSRQLQDGLARQLTPSSATFGNLMLPLVRDDHEASCRLLIFRLFSSVAESAELRDASRKAEQLTSKANAASLMRRDIAALVAAVYERHQNGVESLDGESAYMLFKTHRAYQNAGAGIKDDELRTKYMDTVEERNAVQVAAKKTLSESDEGVWFSRDELDGVPDSVVDTLEKSDDGETFKVTFKRGHLFPVMKHATSAKTRKTLHLAKENRFPENVERLERLVVLRDELARLLGFASHADLKMEDKMASSVESVINRLNDLKTKLKPLAKSEIETLFNIKKAALGDNSGSEDHDEAGTLNAWDWAFYARILEKEQYSVDSLLISEYFEVEHSLKGMLRIFENLFSMDFVPIEAPTWQEDVTVYSVWDVESERDSFLGYLYLDLYARDGKYAGAHCSLIQPGFIKPDETRYYPTSSLICSFIRSSETPTLLQHSELKTMFHELGHAIHKLVTSTKYSHGCARDFVEIPSIMLENWIWVPEVLMSLGRHYSYLSESYKEFWQKRQDGEEGIERPAESLPGKLATDLARTKHVNGAHAMLHQVFLALFDLTIHSPASREAAQATDTTALWNASKRETMGLVTVDGIGQASFAHPFRAYDAAYFTYSLSRVYATDLWVSCFKANPMNKEAGMKYRRHVLQPGGSQPEATSLRNFLGRDPNEVAYHRELAEATL
ncbi:Fc.00g024780.m01.CDS01 [Cosmosporella sp. VM-42]